MEASPFYHHDHHFLLDQCLSSPNPTTTSTRFFDDFNQHYEQVLPTNSIELSAHENQASIGINNLQNSDSSMSMVVHDHKFNKKMPTTNSSFNNADTNDRVKDTCKRGRKQKKSNADKENKKVTDSKEEGQLGYIYVRARRGQATDSHSLAERVRREKISEKMKTLQAIVPGCDKITGKALMLDEVINYVQSLQNEIQILSLELASVNPMLNDYGTDFEEFMLKPHQDMTTNQQQLFSFQENQMPCMISQNNGEALWEFEEQGQEQLDDPFAITNFNSF